MAAKPKGRDAGLELIDTWERWLVDVSLQQWRDDGRDEAAITKARVELEALAAAIAGRMRDDYRINAERSLQP